MLRVGRKSMKVFDARLPLLLCVTSAVSFSTPSSAQGVYRTEIHPLVTMTLTTADFLLGKKDGKPATIAGELRIPKPGTDKLPVIVIVHGSDGVGFNYGMWAQELNKAGF